MNVWTFLDHNMREIAVVVMMGMFLWFVGRVIRS